MFFFSSITISLILAGFWAARTNMGALHYRNQYNPFHAFLKSANLKEQLILITLLSISTVVLFLFTSVIGWENVALLAAIRGVDSDSTLNYLRSEMGNSFEGKYHWYHLFMRDFLSIASFGLFAHWLLSKRFFSCLVFLISFLVTAFSMLMAIEKGPFIWYLFGLFLAYTIVKKSGKISFKQFFMAIAFGLVFMSLIYSTFYGSNNFLTNIKSIFSRIINGQMVGLFHYLTIFPEQCSYLFGKSFPNPGGILFWEPISLTVFVNDIVNPDDQKNDIIGSMPTFFWGEMYANFGFLGILIPPFFVGYFTYALNIIFFRIQPSPIFLATFVWLLRFVADISGTGLSGYIINVTGFVILCFTLSNMVLLNRKIKLHQRKQPKQKHYKSINLSKRQSTRYNKGHNFHANNKNNRFLIKNQ